MNTINKANVILKIFKISEELVVVVVVVVAFGLSVNSHLAGSGSLAATNVHTLPSGTSVAAEQAAALSGFEILPQAVLWVYTIIKESKQKKINLFI